MSTTKEKPLCMLPINGVVEGMSEPDRGLRFAGEQAYGQGTSQLRG